MLLSLVALLCAGNLWATFVRSAIPLKLEGRVEAIDIRREKHPGIDDVYLVQIGAENVHLDREIASRLEVGQKVSKGPWSNELILDSRDLELTPSKDFWRMLVAMPLLALCALLVTRRGDRQSSPPSP